MSASTCFEMGVIGAGSMGAGLLRAWVGSGALEPGQVAVWEVDSAKGQGLQRELSVVPASGAEALLRRSATVLLAVKPQTLPELLGPLRGGFRAEQLVISVAAGVNLARLRELVGAGPALVRVMPNLLCTVGEGASAYCGSAEATEEQLARVGDLFSRVGLALRVRETEMDAVTGLSGSGPAFAALFCEALADGGVAAGLARPVAQTLAAQVLVGTGRWVLAQGSPAALKDQVASPGGTTIAGVAALEAGGLRAAAMRAVQAAAERSAWLGRPTEESP